MLIISKITVLDTGHTLMKRYSPCFQKLCLLDIVLQFLWRVVSDKVILNGSIVIEKYLWTTGWVKDILVSNVFIGAVSVINKS